MEFNFVKSQVKRISRNRIILMLIVIAITATMIYMFAPTFDNLYFQEAELKSTSEIKSLYNDRKTFVRTNAPLLSDTNSKLLKDGKATTKYYALVTNEGLVLCRTGTEMTESTYTDYEVNGKLKEPTKQDQEVINKLKSELIKNNVITRTEASQMFSPYVLDLESSRLLDQIVVGIGLLIILFAVLKILVSIIQLTDYTKNKSYKKLDISSGGSAEYIDQSVSRDFSKDMFTLNKKYLKITPTWIAKMTLLTFSLHKKEDAIWIHETITRHRTNGIPSGKSYTIVLHFKNGENLSIPERGKKGADALLALLMQDIPHALFGYNDELSSLYHNNIIQFIEMQKDYAASKAEDTTTTTE